MLSCLSREHQREVKCQQLSPGFELGSLIQFSIRFRFFMFNGISTFVI